AIPACLRGRLPHNINYPDPSRIDVFKLRGQGPRSAEYRNFENTLAEFRRAFLARQAGSEHLVDVLAELHRSRYYIGHLGSDEVISIVERIDLLCQTLAVHVEPVERAEWWRTRIRPLRTELSEAVKRSLIGS
ncbi:hypothetical protein, partial [Streptomyces sp. NPDC059970]|uniref:hypothetical protein n=1 Tax=Streptomyces sp. NPDC059970 TaxID=3347019 RepID=UPI00369E5B74